MDNPTPEYRDGLIQEIHEAFRGANREGGVSWSEAEVLDDRGSMEDGLAARRNDKDRTWQELVDAEWDEHPNAGGWVFLDAIGFRYYIAPAMIRAIRSGSSELDSCLIPSQPFREFTIEKFRLLDEPQLRCIRFFLSYMNQVEGEEFCSRWDEAREAYWDGIG